ncbi:MAG: hypothetical protein QNJ70_28050 [Xenococcaceae cyanobacterium MO_207.B15]|nr:hypothetical protein [Xenococcaceae cyanobacterium MO_207.B15]
MKREDDQKVKKHLQKKVALVAGLIGSLGFLSVAVIGGWQTFRKDPIAPHIEFIEEEIKPASRDLELYLKLDSDPDFELDFELDLESDFESNFELNFVFSLAPELYDFESNLRHNFELYFQRYLGRYVYLNPDFESNFELNFVFSLAPELYDFESNLGHNFELYFERYLEHDLELYFKLDLERDFEIIFFKKMVRINFYSSLLKKRIIPEKYYRYISELLLKELNQIIEMPQKFGLTENQEFLTIQEKQSKLIQFLLLAILSAIGLTTFFLLLIQRNQGVTWSMTGMYLLPEECVAAMETLYETLEGGEEPTWKIRLIMLWNIAVLLKNFYIQVKIEDLFLPNKNTSD